MKRDLLKSIFFNIIISNILKKCQYFSSQIFCNSLLPKVNLPQQALCFGMTSTTLIKTHEIITVFLSGIPFCSNGAAFDSKHPMETKPAPQSSYSSHQRCSSSLYESNRAKDGAISWLGGGAFTKPTAPLPIFFFSILKSTKNIQIKNKMR